MDERQSIAPPNGNEPVSEKGIIAQLALPRCVFFAFSGPETRLGRNPIPGVGLKSAGWGHVRSELLRGVRRYCSREGLIEAAKLGRVAGRSREARARPPCQRT